MKQKQNEDETCKVQCSYFRSSVCIRFVFWIISVSRLFTVLLVATRSQNWLACSVLTCKEKKPIRSSKEKRVPDGIAI